MAGVRAPACVSSCCLGISCYKPESASGCADCYVLQVMSVSKVHNRHLRLQFEKATNSNISSEAGDKQPCTEYLFYGQHPAQPGELLQLEAADGGVRMIISVFYVMQLTWPGRLPRGMVAPHDFAGHQHRHPWCVTLQESSPTWCSTASERLQTTATWALMVRYAWQTMLILLTSSGCSTA